MAGKERELLGDWSVAELRGSGDYKDLVEVIATLVDFSSRTVRKRLEGAHGRSLVRNVFEDGWQDRVEEIGELTVAAAKEFELVDDIARIVRLTARTVAKRMEGVHGRSKVETVFADEWPTRVADDADDDDGGEDGSSAGETDDEEDEHQDAEEAYADPSSADARQRSLLAFAGLAPDQSKWSRPRPLKRVLRRLGMEVPDRLRGARFHEVLARLHTLGFELLTEGTERAAGHGDPSPGIAARVCLRITGRGHQVEVTREPIRVVPSNRQPPVAAHLPRSDYELALLRLKFLTAIPSMDRERSSRWPGDFVEAATRGLTLTDADQRLLPKIAASLRRGTHDPREAGLDLARRGEQEWETLFASLRDLNDDLWEVAEEVIAQVAILVPRAAVPRAPNTSKELAEPATSPSPARVESTQQGPRPEPVAATATNDRPLGPLDDLFK